MKYKGKEVRFIKDYGRWILIEHEEGYKEGIHKHELGILKETVKPPRTNINPEKVIIFRNRRHR